MRACGAPFYLRHLLRSLLAPFGQVHSICPDATFATYAKIDERPRVVNSWQQMMAVRGPGSASLNPDSQAVQHPTVSYGPSQSQQCVA